MTNSSEEEKINFDKRIRTLQKKKDMETVTQVKLDLAREEEELKAYFEDS